MNIMGLKIGAKLELYLVNSSGKKAFYSYASQLLDIIDESNIIISHPIRASRLVFIPTGASVEIVLAHGSLGLLTFKGTITAKSDTENVAWLSVHIDSKPRRTQRRQYFRVNCCLNVKYRLLNGENGEDGSENSADDGTDVISEEQEIENIEYKNAVTSDLSGSGMCIITDENLPEGSVVEVIISLGDDIPIKAVCRVARSSSSEHARDIKYKIGMNFIKISNIDRDIIIKYLLNLQKELIKKKEIT